MEVVQKEVGSGRALVVPSGGGLVTIHTLQLLWTYQKLQG